MFECMVRIDVDSWKKKPRAVYANLQLLTVYLYACRGFMPFHSIVWSQVATPHATFVNFSANLETKNQLVCWFESWDFANLNCGYGLQLRRMDVFLISSKGCILQVLVGKSLASWQIKCMASPPLIVGMQRAQLKLPCCNFCRVGIHRVTSNRNSLATNPTNWTNMNKNECKWLELT